jgi:hypothetical protein
VGSVDTEDVNDPCRASQIRQVLRFAVRRYSPHTALRVWFAGGLNRWSLIPSGTWGFVTALDRLLI